MRSSTKKSVIYPDIQQNSCNPPVSHTFIHHVEGELEHIFNCFEQNSGTINAEGSTGLNFPICKGLIEAHKGKIRADYAPDGGTTLAFCIPLIQPVQ